MKASFEAIALNVTGGEEVESVEHIQTLWSGYGEILRVYVNGGTHPSIVLKSIVLPEAVKHPRGWNTDRSHARKLKSYDVEMHWYRDWSHRCGDMCRVASCLEVVSSGGQQTIVLEDLNAAGFDARKEALTQRELAVCLSWLANFHATFLNEPVPGLWATGTYWHLATRPDELAAMQDIELQRAASDIDRALNGSRYQTIVHGDAKVANFCFSSDGASVAAVDFQYVGGGCGMKDVAYLMGSCLTEQQCELWEGELLAIYFQEVELALQRLNKDVDFKALKSEWLSLFPYAWADFHRFLLGWMPSHAKVNGYSERLTSRVIADLAKKPFD